LLPLLSACKVTRFSETLPNGTIVTASDKRFLVNTAAKLKGVVNPTNGIVTIDIDVTSSPDSAIIEAAVKAAIETTIKSLKPGP